MICNKCTNKLPDDSEFCQYCGNKIVKQVIIPDKVIKEKKENVETNTSDTIETAVHTNSEITYSEAANKLLKVIDDNEFLELFERYRSLNSKNKQLVKDLIFALSE
ncbi:MAG: zinc ribbon domain-containing protein [Clostridia bacterium]|nr:zinc ribbon domain-containing protein [Clostridia bacterium]